MNKQELESLLSESEDYIESRAEVTVRGRAASGKMESEIYQLTGSHSLGFSTIHERGEGVDEEEMYWVAFAILEDKNGKNKIEKIPLDVVLGSIKKGEILARSFFDR